MFQISEIRSTGDVFFYLDTFHKGLAILAAAFLLSVSFAPGVAEAQGILPTPELLRVAQASSPQTAAVAAPPLGMVGWWPLEKTRDLLTNDVVHGHVGYFLGTPRIARGAVGGAVGLDGLDDYIRIADSEDLRPGREGMTASLWVRVLSSQVVVKGRELPVLNKAATSPSGEDWAGWSLMLEHQRRGLAPRLVILDNKGQKVVLNTDTHIPFDAWTHLAITIQPQVAASLWIDGTKVASRSMDAGLGRIDVAADLLIGRSPAGRDSATYAELEVDELEIFRSVLKQPNRHPYLRPGRDRNPLKLAHKSLRKAPRDGRQKKSLRRARQALQLASRTDTQAGSPCRRLRLPLWLVKAEKRQARLENGCFRLARKLKAGKLRIAALSKAGGTADPRASLRTGSESAPMAAASSARPGPGWDASPGHSAAGADYSEIASEIAEPGTNTGPPS